MKRLKDDAREERRLIDATHGRRTRSILVMDSNHVVLSAIQAETLSQRYAMLRESAWSKWKRDNVKRLGRRRPPAYPDTRAIFLSFRPHPGPASQPCAARCGIISRIFYIRFHTPRGHRAKGSATAWITILSSQMILRREFRASNGLSGLRFTATITALLQNFWTMNYPPGAIFCWK